MCPSPKNNFFLNLLPASLTKYLVQEATDKRDYWERTSPFVSNLYWYETDKYASCHLDIFDIQ